MESKTESPLSRAWKEFKDSFRYAVEAKAGKFSLDIYLNRLSDSIDDYIKKEQVKENSQFKSGYMEVSAEEGNVVNFSIHLNFLAQDGANVEKILCKSIAASAFTEDTLPKLQEGKKKYDIDAPEG